MICFVTTGCALIKLKKDVNKAQESTCIVGRIYAKVKGNGPIIVPATSVDKGKEIAHYTVLHDWAIISDMQSGKTVFMRGNQFN